MKSPRLNVLVADDDPLDCSLVENALKQDGHTISVVYDGKEAIKSLALKHDRFDVLITDHNMPMMSGLELIRHARKNGFAGRIIVMSGHLTRELQVAYQAGRVDKMVLKPVSMKFLADDLSETLDQWAKELPMKHRAASIQPG